MLGITGLGENGWSTLVPKLFLELLLPGLQETQLSPIYSYESFWGEDSGMTAVEVYSAVRLQMWQIE